MIVDEIKSDHKKIQAWIGDLRLGELSLRRQKTILAELNAFLRLHTKAEEKTIYASGTRELKLIVLKCVEEHRVAESFLLKINRAKSNDLWKARVKIFCDFVSHHLEEEELIFLPKLEAHLHARSQRDLGRLYRSLMPDSNDVKKAEVIVLPIPRKQTPLESLIP